jgi:hypothetical protein
MKAQFEKITYIDWNLFSILKNPKLDPHRILQEFLLKNREKLLLAYSDAHLGDLTQTSNETNYRKKDLIYLSNLTNDLLLVKYFGRENVELDKRSPSEFYEDIKDSDSRVFQEVLQKVPDIFKNNYWKLRDEIIRNHFKKEPKEIFNFSLTQLDELIRLTGYFNSLKELVEYGLSLRGENTMNPLTYIDYYTTAYINLDLIGFCPDEMNDKGGFNNLLNDSKHSAYGSLFKAFITNDNKCYYKSKLLFEYFNSKSKLIKTCKIKQDKIENLKKELESLI